MQAVALLGKLLPAKKVTAVDLVNGIRAVLDSQSIRNNARLASQSMKSHDGIAKAIQLIEAQF